MPRPVHFEIPADNVDRAIAFYTKIFGWTFQKWDGPMPYWMLTTGPDGQQGINGGLLPRQHPGQPCANTMDVANVDESLATITANGGEIIDDEIPPTKQPGTIPKFKEKN